MTPELRPARRPRRGPRRDRHRPGAGRSRRRGARRAGCRGAWPRTSSPTCATAFLSLVAPELVQLPDRRRDVVRRPGAAARAPGDRPGHGGARRDAGRAPPCARPPRAARRRPGQAHQRRRRLVAGGAAGPHREAGARGRRPAVGGAGRATAGPAAVADRSKPSPVGPGWASAVRSATVRPRGPATGHDRPTPRPRPRPPIRQPAATPATTPAAAGADGPSRDELTLAWADQLLPRLSRQAKPVLAAGRWVDTDAGVALAVPNEPHRTRCEQHRAELEGALAAHFGRPVPVVFVLERASRPPDPARIRSAGRHRPPRSRRSPIPNAEEAIDPAELVDAGPEHDAGPARAADPGVPRGRAAGRELRWPRPTPPPVQTLIDELGRLPGIGPKSAQRIAFHLLKLPAEDADPPGPRHHRGQGAGPVLRAVLERGRGPGVRHLPDDQRDTRLRVRGRGGARHRGPRDARASSAAATTCCSAPSAPSTASGPSSSRSGSCWSASSPRGSRRSSSAPTPTSRARRPRCTSPGCSSRSGVRVTRLASGLPVGGDLEYADELTLGRALEGRREIAGLTTFGDTTKRAGARRHRPEMHWGTDPRGGSGRTGHLDDRYPRSFSIGAIRRRRALFRLRYNGVEPMTSTDRSRSRQKSLLATLRASNPVICGHRDRLSGPSRASSLVRASGRAGRRPGRHRRTARQRPARHRAA